LCDLIERTCRYAQRFASGLAQAGYQVLNEVVIKGKDCDAHQRFVVGDNRSGRTAQSGSDSENCESGYPATIGEEFQSRLSAVRHALHVHVCFRRREIGARETVVPRERVFIPARP